MTALDLTALLIAALAASALLGPWTLRRAAPVLARFPRAATVLLTGSILAWVLTTAALGPLLAWGLSGPDLLPTGAAAVCQQCLAAANPFAAAPLDTAVPVILLLVVPALGTVLLGTAIAREARRRRRATADTARSLRSRGEYAAVLGHRVLVVDDPHPFALTLPRRSGGIALSTAALRSLPAGELAAVLAHEEAHLAQRHHLVTAAVASISRHLRWVPLIAAAESALGHCLEIAADDAARRHAGIPALAGALLALAEHAPAVHRTVASDGALHAVGPDRILHLVQPRSGAAGFLPALAAIAIPTALGLLAAAVHVPYVLAVLTGCA